MKHAGSNDEFQQRIESVADTSPPRIPVTAYPAAQSRTSILVSLAAGLLFLAVIADAPVRQLADTLDPSLTAALRHATEFGNSAWPIIVGLSVLAVVHVVRRRVASVSQADLLSLRSAMILMVGSVAVSGFLASLSKHMIGRIRPSTSPEALVLDFAVMAFDPGWASFPSGHATTATACAVALACSFPRQAWAWVSIGAFASLSRAFLGVHWLTDCVAGVILGAAVTAGIHHRMLARGHRPQVPPGTLPRALSASAGLAAGALGSALSRLRARD